MDDLPDIRALYQKKYLQKTHIYNNTARLHSQNKLNHRYQLFSPQHMSPVEKPMIKCVKIVKNQSQSHQLEQISSSDIGGNNAEWQDNGNKLKLSRSMHDTGHKRTELARQLMRLTQNQMKQFQVSVGEKSLLGIFQVFFQRRNKTKEKNRQDPKKYNSKPIQNISSRQHNKSVQSKPTFSSSNKQRPMLRSRLRQRDLAPWQIQDLDPV